MTQQFSPNELSWTSIDTRHADAAYARQVADEFAPTAEFPIGTQAFIREFDDRTGDDLFTPVTVVGQHDRAGYVHVIARDAVERQTVAVADLVRRAVDVMADEKDFGAAHDAHMARVYAEPWDQTPTADPATGDALTGAYGRTYAEGGYLLMQAARDVFGPYTGHCPILLMQATTDDGRPYLHGALGGCVLTHTDTFDTWDAALRAMRTRINATLDSTRYLD